MAKWCLAHHEESFLYTHFAEICDIMKRSMTCRSRSATVCGLVAVADANDQSQFGGTTNPR